MHSILRVAHEVCPNSLLPGRVKGFKPVFMEDWFLDAVAPDAWESVNVVSGGQTVGWLPYANTRQHGFKKCGIPNLSRLLQPQVALTGKKRETQLRHRFETESELIAKLPPASCYEFVLSGDDQSALAWQAHGFTARIHYSLQLDPDVAKDTLWQGLRDKTRNLVRRAQETLRVTEIDGATFAKEYQRNLAGRQANFDLCLIERVADAAAMAGHGHILASRDAAGVIHAAVFFLWDAQTQYYFMTTRNTGSQHLGATALLVWTGMLDASERGLSFDFDGITSRTTLRFLQAFGGRVVERASLAYDTRRWLVKAKRTLLGQPISTFT
jgi:Acetyltransferase (GNAT) domain